MYKPLSAGTAAFAAVMSFYGCKSSESKPTPAGEGGESGSTAMGGKGGSPSAGTSGSAGHGGSSGATSGGSAGKGMAGSHAGEADVAGAAGDNGSGGSSASGSGGSNSAAGSPGDAGSDGQAGPEDLGLVLGPETDDQAPISVGSDHGGFPIDQSVLLVDADGNLFVADGTKLYKYKPNLELDWSYSLYAIAGVQSLAEPSLSLASDGGLFFGGITQMALPGEEYGGGSSDAVVGKLSANGDLEWLHQLGGAGQESTALTARTSDGAVIATGDASGQLPGMPSTVSGGPWLARYESDGTRTFLHQYDKWKVGGGNNYGKLFIDADDEIVLVGSASTFLADSDGKELARHGSSVPGDNIPGGTLVPLALDATKRAFYSWPYTGALTKRDVAGAPIWFRNREPDRMAEIDSVENVIWTGTLGTFDTTGGVYPQPVAVADDALYLTGIYTNRYKNGSTPRPTTTALFVGRYELDGSRVWFQELTFEGLAGIPLSCRGIALDDGGNPVLAVRGGTATTGFLFKLKKSDGSLL